MRIKVWRTSLLLAALGVACGDQPTEVVPEREMTGGPGLTAAATDSSADGRVITTDKDDYAPGDTVWFTGSGWTPGDVLDVVLTDEPTNHRHEWSIDVGPNGTFRDSTYVVDNDDLGVTFTLVATSRANPEQTLRVKFTDGAVRVRTNGPTGVSISWTKFNGSSNCTVGPTSSGSTTVGTSFATTVGVDGGQSIRLTAPGSAGALTFSHWTLPDGTTTSTSNPFCLAGVSGVQQLTVNYAAANTAPNAPASLAQFKSNGTTSIPTGGATNEASVVLKATVSDPNAGNTVKLQVEVRPVGTAFSNTHTAESALITSGTTASVTVTGLTNTTHYHWQARAVDNSGATGSWVSFGGNTEADTDFRVLTDAPLVTINKAAAQPDPTNASPINFTVVFNEAVTGFVTGDVTLGGTAGATTQLVTGSGTTYNVAVSGMTGDGTVTASIAANVATDAAGNANLASSSTDNEVAYDITGPSVTINKAAAQDDPTNASPINFTVVFNEAVTNFATGDATLTGTAGPTTQLVSGSGTTYNVAVSGMGQDGTVIATIAAGKATDALGNPSTVSTSTDNSVIYDVTPPDITCGAADGVWHASNVSISCTASDEPAGLANSADASFSLTTNVADGSETSNASTNSKTVFDQAGNSATAGPITGNKIDRKDPEIDCGTADGNWHGTDVSIACTASDGGSGLAVAGDASFNLTTNVAAGSETSTASTGTKSVADAVGNSATAGPITGNKVDKKGPVVTLTCPATPVILGSSANASWTAADGGSGVASGYASGNITLATNAVGSQTGTAPLGTSKDNVANDSPIATCTYSVIFNWTGFFQPVDNENLNVAKAGSAIPVKFNLGGYQGLSIFAAGYPSSSQVNCAAIDQDEDMIELTVNPGGSSLTYDAAAQQYVYVWKTDKGWVGKCRRLDVKLIDGTTHSAYFKFK